MPSASGPLFVWFRLPSGDRVRVPLDWVTNHMRGYSDGLASARKETMAISRDELKAKRLAACGVVGSQMEATAAMYDRVIAAGAHVEAARTAAESAHMADLNSQVADLKEMAEELTEFGQTVPTSAPASGKPSGAGAAIASPAPKTAALDALMNAQPYPQGWDKGDAYVETHPAPKT